MTFQVIMTENCNLRCKYCFENRQRNDSVISKRVVDFIPEFIIRYLNNDFVLNSDKVIINFNGGEPLLEFEQIKNVISKFNKYDKRIYFQISTNLTLLSNDMIDFFEECDISLHVSIDGNKQTHDRYRIFGDGSPTHDIVLKNLERLKKTRIKNKVSLSMVFCPETVINLSSNIDYLSSLGVDMIYSSICLDFNWTPNYIAILKNEIIKAAEFYKRRFENNNPIFLSLFTKTITNTLKMKKSIGCGAFRDIVAIRPNGELLPCLAYLGVKSNQYYGTMFNDQSIVEIKKFLDQIKIKPQCINCSLSDRCNNYCPALSQKFKDNKSIENVICVLNKTTIIQSDEIARSLLESSNKAFIRQFTNKQEVF